MYLPLSVQEIHIKSVKYLPSSCYISCGLCTPLKHRLRWSLAAGGWVTTFSLPCTAAVSAEQGPTMATEATLLTRTGQRASLPAHRAPTVTPAELSGAAQPSRLHHRPTTAVYHRTARSASLHMKRPKRRKKLSEPRKRELGVGGKGWSSIRALRSSAAALLPPSNPSKSQHRAPAAGPSGSVAPCTPLPGHHVRQQPPGKKAHSVAWLKSPVPTLHSS